MKKVAASFSITADYAFAAFSVIQDCLRHCPSIQEYILFLEGELPEKDLQALCRDAAVSIRPYALSDAYYHSYSQPSAGRFPRILFSRFENIALLQEYKQIIAFDVDQVITKNISGLLQLNEPFVFVKGGETLKPNFHDVPAGYDASQPAVNANLMIFNREPLAHLANPTELTEWCYFGLMRYGSNIYLPEQAIFNLLFQRYSLPVALIDGLDYSCHPTHENASKASIIHTYGQPKFWNGLKNEQFDLNYQLWLEYGGTPHRWEPVGQTESNQNPPQEQSTTSILGGSSNLFDNNIESILQKIKPELTIELGCGAGKLGMLHTKALKTDPQTNASAEYKLVGIQPGVTEGDLRLLAQRGYDQIVSLSIQDYCDNYIDTNCSLFVAIDVLEHLPRHMIFSVIDQLLYHCQYFLIIWPSKHPQNANGNTFDAHRSSFSLSDIATQFTILTYLETGFAQISSWHRYHLILVRGHMNISNNTILY